MSRNIARVSLVVAIPLPKYITPRKAKEWVERQVRGGDLPIGTRLVLTEALTVSKESDDA
jgi:hypothetical protein